MLSSGLIIGMIFIIGPSKLRATVSTNTLKAPIKSPRPSEDALKIAAYWSACSPHTAHTAGNASPWLTRIEVYSILLPTSSAFRWQAGQVPSGFGNTFVRQCGHSMITSIGPAINLVLLKNGYRLAGNRDCHKAELPDQARQLLSVRIEHPTRPPARRTLGAIRGQSRRE